VTAPTLIVGGSLAGLRAAQAMRADGHLDEIVVIGDEPELPYTRPPLSKGVLGGSESPESTDLGAAALDVTWRLGVRAVGVDRAAREVILEDGERQPYRRLLAATGCRARSWPASGAELTGVLTLRSLSDAMELRARLEKAERLVTIGAGFIGCEVAATARGLGLEVAMVDIAPLPIPAFGTQVGTWIANRHREHGVELHLGVGAARIEGDGELEAVVLGDGTRLEADVGVVALGAVPETDWLAGSGLALDGGLLCDRTLTSVSDPDILAAGDLCTWPHPLDDGPPVRVEHWTNAVEQGRLAGRNLLRDPGDREPYAAVPSMWSDQYETRIQVAGLPTPGDETRILEGGLSDDRCAIAMSRAGRLVAAAVIGAPRRFVWYRRQIEQRASLAEVTAAIGADEMALATPAEVSAA
jgi:3-phenylpropionate/trans-cinnamate dioxygenase ferredoxin reductase component